MAEKNDMPIKKDVKNKRKSRIIKRIRSDTNGGMSVKHNLFAFATSELSQDAFFCWSLDCLNRDEDSPLYGLGRSSCCQAVRMMPCRRLKVLLSGGNLSMWMFWLW